MGLDFYKMSKRIKRASVVLFLWVTADTMVLGHGNPDCDDTVSFVFFLYILLKKDEEMGLMLLTYTQTITYEIKHMKCKCALVVLRKLGTGAESLLGRYQLRRSH